VANQRNKKGYERTKNKGKRKKRERRALDKSLGAGKIKGWKTPSIRRPGKWSF
jgi:hypothetical protein